MTKLCRGCNVRKPIESFPLDKWGRVDIRKCVGCQGPQVRATTTPAAAVNTHRYEYQDGPCSVDGCSEDAKTRGMCRRHYQTWWETGSPIRPPREGRDYMCVIDGCDNVSNRRHSPGGMCVYHLGRKAKTGSPTTPLRIRGGTTPCKYSGAHRRIRDSRGRASEHECVDCGQQADDWSYRGGSALEMTEPRLTGSGGNYVIVAYSPDPMDYDPRCKSCHNRYDNPANKRVFSCAA